MQRFSRILPRSMWLTVFAAVLIGCSSSNNGIGTYDGPGRTESGTVEAGEFDGGRMWTFEYPPLDYFEKTYDFRPDKDWMEDVRMSALKFATWCSASFVSGDGLVMTNHHCARSSAVKVQKEDENLMQSGFYAATIEEERKVPELFVEQLVEIRDVTDEIFSVMEAAESNEAKIAARQNRIMEIQAAVSEETGNRPQVVTLYKGAKYSLYIFKRYEDVRLVFAPELHIAHYGGEYDNFTYPRYSLDFSFFRVYDENGDPLKTDRYFKWSKNGAAVGEAVFVIGNPGRTGRLNTVDQLEYNRDVRYPFIAQLLNNRAEILKTYVNKHPEKKEELLQQILGNANSQKAYNGMLGGLRNDVLMQRRKSFDSKFRSAVESKPELKSKYGHIWDEIAETRRTMRSVSSDLYALWMNGFGGSALLRRAHSMLLYGQELAKPEEDRSENYRGDKLEKIRKALANQNLDDTEMEEMTLAKQLAMMKDMLGDADPVVSLAFPGSDAREAARNLLGSTIMNDSVKVANLLNNPEKILASDDPMIKIAGMAKPRRDKALEVSNSITARDQVNATLLGRALYDIYGTSIPPDATFTLRLADGIVEGYEYNGTKAPPYTTFFGLYDRANSFPGEESWELPERWRTPPAGFDLGTPYNFSSTNDIIGGNSGSPLINRNREIVGIAFDGNIESLPGDYIFAEDMANRTVSVHSSGILESLQHVYRALRIVRELEEGGMSDR